MNTIGLWTLYCKEVRRFLKVAMQTLAAPAVTTLLFLAVFVLALHRDQEVVAGVGFVSFLVPGLLMMAITQNAFANSSSSMVIGKVNGNIVDVLLPPLSPFEMTAAYAFGAVTRGLLVGFVVGLIMWLFVPVRIIYPLWLLFFAVQGALLLGLIGTLAGIWADKFDHMATITNFLVTPLSFLSGTFYSIQKLPPVWYTIAHFNPFFFMIDGVRYAMTGHTDTTNILPGAGVLLVLNIFLWGWCQRLFSTGYKLRA